MRFAYVCLMILVCHPGSALAQPAADTRAPSTDTVTAPSPPPDTVTDTVTDATPATATDTTTATATDTVTVTAADTATTSATATDTPPTSAPLPRPTEHPLLAIDDELFLGFLAIGGWGVARWKWFKSEFKFKKEHGFSRRSSTGGSDKTGHFFAGYIVGDLLAWRLREMGYERTEAALWGATGSMALMTWIEIGDATSRYGWSFEDLLADFIGVAVSAALGVWPVLDDLLDFRVQYWPSEGFLNGDNDDLVADYSGMKHLVALKLSGIPYLKDTPLRFLEAQFGYYSRGFRSFDATDPADTRRVLYFGLGVTATELLKPVLPKVPGVRAWSPGILTLFEYYQPPFLALEAASKEW